MALIRWEPARELHSVQSEINRLFNTLLDAPTQTMTPAGQRRWIPAMDLVETDGHFVLRADLPGLTEKDVKIELQDNVLTIAGERKFELDERKEGFFRLERTSGSFSRSLTLPEGIDPAGVAATFTSGVLEVQIPKPEVRKPQKIEISVTGSEQQNTIEGSETSAANGSDPALASARA
ncbi:MAG TPA: Hsp20/alpha crystallin family protein [Solirubrobacteraceae bacterium]|jgi:HSP20 family protein|nr:Hsp20/alpha crystallin family protein [Solirubrobacteraceae bacterium]